jgi:hypothetical protein
MNGEIVIAGAILVFAGSKRNDCGGIILTVWGVGTMLLGWVM